jgi:hypothetical protein
MISLHRRLLAGIVVCFVVGFASAEDCPGVPTEYQTTCDCTNKPFTTLYCDTTHCQGDEGCGPCAVALPGNYCGSAGHQSCYIATVTYTCTTGLDRSHATSKFWNSLKSDVASVSVFSGQPISTASAHK